MTRRLSDLNEHLFAQMDRLASAETAETVAQEATRAEALVEVADQILDTARLQLDAAKLFAQQGPGILPLLPQIGDADTGAARLTAAPPKK
jgi:hypothetical protein